MHPISKVKTQSSTDACHWLSNTTVSQVLYTNELLLWGRGSLIHSLRLGHTTTWTSIRNTTTSSITHITTPGCIAQQDMNSL